MTAARSRRPMLRAVGKHGKPSNKAARYALAGLTVALAATGAAFTALGPAGSAATGAMDVAPDVSSTGPMAVIPANYGVPHPKLSVQLARQAVVSHAAHKAHLIAMAARAAVTRPAVTPTTPAPGGTITTVANTPSPVTSTASSPPPSQPASASGSSAVLNEALTMAGVPYVYGGDSPSGFDCSGLVYWAALQVGVSSMPRDTFEMLAQGVSSGLLVPVSDPSYGDLAFFGSGHVEFYIKPGETFGAQQPGTDVGYHSYGNGYAPTAFYAIG